MTEWAPGTAPTTTWDQEAGMLPSDPGVADNISDLVERAEIAATNAETAETNAETAQTAAETAQGAAETAKTGAETAQTASEAAQSYSEEWATKAEDSLISVAAGGDGSTDYSSLHHAAKASASASAASSSASAASTSASAASTSASAASTSATAAASSATAAAGSATSAASAQSAAESARDSALAAYDNFDDRYLGPKASDPTVDNDGDALVAGALYYNTTDSAMKLYTGSAWVAAYISGAGYLQASNNLSDLGDAATARTNLGLGTAATTASTDYATAAQGALADSALQSFTETNDLTAAVTWANVPDANITQTSVTQHQAALSITEGQISNLGADIVLDSDIGVTVQGYDADTVKYDDVNPSFTDTGAVKVPTGTTAQQPGTPVAGQFRFNSETGQFEGYNGTAWGAIAGGSGGGAGLQDMFLLMGA